MKVGFDFWNVISHYPDHIAQLVFGQVELGCEVHVISAIGKGRIGTIQREVEEAFDGSHYLVEPEDYTVHEVVTDRHHKSPELKLAKCKELGLDMFFDDRQDVCDLLNANGILAFVVPRKNKTTDEKGDRK